MLSFLGMSQQGATPLPIPAKWSVASGRPSSSSAWPSLRASHGAAPDAEDGEGIAASDTSDELDDDAKDSAGDVERDSDGSWYCWCGPTTSSSASVSSVTSLVASEGVDANDA